MTTSMSSRASRWMRAATLMFAFAALPFATATAQEGGGPGLGARLREAVKAGKITPQEAREKLQELRKRMVERRGERGEGGERDRRGPRGHQGQGRSRGKEVGVARQKAAQVRARLREAIRAGKITPKEAREKFRALRKQMAKEHGPRRQRADRDRPGPRGRRGDHDRPGPRGRRGDHDRPGPRGRRGDHDRPGRGPGRGLQGDHRGIARQKFREMGARLREAVKAGKITPKEAREKFRALRKRIAEAREGREGRGDRGRNGPRGKPRRHDGDEEKRPGRRRIIR